MSDEAPSAVASWNVRVIFGSIVLAFCLATVSWVTVFGSPTNSLHQSAQSWSFGIIIAILAGFGVGTFAAPLVAALKK